MKDISRNLTMLCDFYELTMAGGYFRSGIGDRIAYFDLFYRDNPDGGGYAVVAGLEQIVDYIRNLHFTEEDIPFCAARAASTSRSSITCAAFVLPAICGRCRREPSCSPANR